MAANFVLQVLAIGPNTGFTNYISTWIFFCTTLLKGFSILINDLKVNNPNKVLSPLNTHVFFFA
jgi:hypothetical protein